MLFYINVILWSVGENAISHSAKGKVWLIACLLTAIQSYISHLYIVSIKLKIFFVQQILWHRINIMETLHVHQSPISPDFVTFHIEQKSK